jgi:hypothetical protein
MYDAASPPAAHHLCNYDLIGMMMIFTYSYMVMRLMNIYIHISQVPQGIVCSQQWPGTKSRNGR